MKDDVYNSLEMGRMREESSQQLVYYRAMMRLEDWIWRKGERDEDLKLAYFLPWLEWPSGSQGMPAGLDPGINH